MEPKGETVTRLLASLGAEGDAGSDRRILDRVFEILYAELRQIAGRQRRRWKGNDTLDTSALVHEAWVRLVGQDGIDVDGRAHFHALAARAMRHILCDYARERGAAKRGGRLARATGRELAGLADGQIAFEDRDAEVLVALDEALHRLESEDPRRARVVEARFFGSLSVEETAAALGVSARTVKRDWAVAQAWLHRELVDAS